jgi:hypothetical protein
VSVRCPSPNKNFPSACPVCFPAFFSCSRTKNLVLPPSPQNPGNISNSSGLAPRTHNLASLVEFHNFMGVPQVPGHPTPSFYIGRGTRVLPLRLIPQELLVRRSPGYLPAVARLDAVLDPGVPASRSSLTRSPHGLRPDGEDRHNPKILGSRGYVSDSGLHPSPRRTRLTMPQAHTCGRYATERLTRPYSGGLVRLTRFPLNRQPLPGCPILPSFLPFLI